MNRIDDIIRDLYNQYGSDETLIDTGKRGTFYRLQEPRPGYIDARNSLFTPSITNLGE